MSKKNIEKKKNDDILEDDEKKVDDENKQQDIKKQKEDEDIVKLNDLLLRTTAEFDNYKKRTQKEMVQKYNVGVIDTVKKFIDVLENLERALENLKEDNDIKKGIEMTLNQFNTALTDLKVETVNPLNDVFDPNFHNAVMHIEDSSLPHNTICEVFRKGYKIGDKVIRFAMVKVAN